MPTRRHGSNWHDVLAVNRDGIPTSNVRKYLMDTIAFINLVAFFLLIVLMGLFIRTPEEFEGESATDTMPALLGQRPQ
jgi:hypothetical protein